MKKLWIILTQLVIGLAFNSVFAANAAIITQQELLTRIEAGKAPFILDVRTQREFDAGHIPGAINISHRELPARIKEILSRADDEMVVHCQGGRRAGIAEAILLQHGFTNVKHLQGDMRAWRANKLVIE